MADSLVSEKNAKVSIAFLCKLPPFLDNIYPEYISIFLLVVVETALRAKLCNALDLLNF